MSADHRWSFSIVNAPSGPKTLTGSRRPSRGHLRALPHDASGQGSPLPASRLAGSMAPVRARSRLSPAWPREGQVHDLGARAASAGPGDDQAGKEGSRGV